MDNFAGSVRPYTTFKYNGLGDRLEQTIDVRKEHNTLDLVGETRIQMHGNGR